VESVFNGTFITKNRIVYIFLYKNQFTLIMHFTLMILNIILFILNTNYYHKVHPNKLNNQLKTTNLIFEISIYIYFLNIYKKMQK